MMDASAIEVLAALLIVLTVVKLTVFLVNAQAWIALVKALYSRPVATSTVAYLLAGLVLYVLVQSGLTMVQILAVCLFVALLFISGFAPYASAVLARFQNKGPGRIPKDLWLYTAIWVVLLGWGVYELLGPSLRMDPAAFTTAASHSPACCCRRLSDPFGTEARYDVARHRNGHGSLRRPIACGRGHGRLATITRSTLFASCLSDSVRFLLR